MSNGSNDLTDKQVIEQMIVDDKALGFRLANPEYQNELVVRFAGFWNPKFRDLAYDGKLLKEVLKCHPVEGIVRTASELVKARPHLNHASLTPYQRNILEVLDEMEKQGFGNDVYHESTWLCFNLWMKESKEIRDFMQQSPSLIYQARHACNAISVSRLRRFLVKEEYGNKPAAVIQ